MVVRTAAYSTVLLLAGLSTAAPAAAQRGTDSVVHLTPETITGWRSGARTPIGVEGLSLYGSAASPGPYVIRTRFRSGAGLRPHYHAQTVTITVISGTFRLGLGERIDSTAAHAYPPGSFLVIPAGAPHYEWGDGETVIQLSGVGPLGLIMSPDASAAPAPR